MNHPKISGVIPPLVTPLTDGLVFDKEAFGRLIEHVIEGNVHGIFIMGTNGEGASLNLNTRKNIIESSVPLISGRVPLFVNISSTSYLDTIDLAEYASGAGADYVVLTPPYYFGMNQCELRRYFETVADWSNLPLFMYNAPQYTGNELAPETVSILASHDNIIGIKDSSGNTDYINGLLDDRKDNDFSILIGTEKILGECVLNGCDGGVSGGGNLFPKLYVKMYQAASNKDLDQMKHYQTIINNVYKYIYEVSDSPMAILIGLKYALSVKGIISESLAIPVYDVLTDSQKRTIEKFLKETDQYDI